MTEKEFLKEELENTPHSLLEELFKNFDNKRIQTEEKMTKLRSKIKMLKEEHIEIEQEIEKLTGEELKQEIEGLKSHQAMIDERKEEWKQLRQNTEIIWQNQLKIGEILGYDLEE